MTPSRSYATAGAFRRALEERLKGISQTEQVDLNRLRRQVSFDRLLARLFRDDAAPWVLKGGYALELRFKLARSTIDIDLTINGITGTTEGGESAARVREMLQERAAEEEANRRWRFDQYLRSVMNAGDRRVINFGALPRQMIWK